MSSPKVLSLDVLEVGGRGGVFQHSLAACISLADAGHEVRLHTATDCEIEDTRITYCHCFDWKRDSRLRALRVGFHFVFRTVPHLARQRGDAVWIQGTFKAFLTVMAIFVLRAAGKMVIFSPHNLFSRTGSKAEARFISQAVKISSKTIVYNRADADALRSAGIATKFLPLAMYAPIVPAERLAYWTGELGTKVDSVCSIGQIRPDKNIGLLIDACRETNTRLVVMGPDAGGQAEARAHVVEGSPTVLWYEGYYPLEDMAAVIALVGSVALPYSQASQSAVAELASAYGATVIAYDTGGLRDQADILVSTLEVKDWANAIADRPVNGPSHMQGQSWEPNERLTVNELVTGIEGLFDA